MEFLTLIIAIAVVLCVRPSSHEVVCSFHARRFMNPDGAALGTSPEPVYYLGRVRLTMSSPLVVLTSDLRAQRLLIAAISGAVVANTSVTLALVYYLYMAGTATTFRGYVSLLRVCHNVPIVAYSTRSLLKVLIRYIISSGQTR